MSVDAWDGKQERRLVEKRSNLERHVQSGLLVVVVGVIGWVGTQVADLSQNVARLEERMAGLDLRLVEVRRALDSGQKVTTANVREIDLVKSEVREVREAVQDHEERLRVLERRP